jgi:NADH-quinone oxidoreductase subunit G
VVTSGPVREDQFAARSLRAAAGEELATLAELSDDLKKHSSLIVLYGPSIKGDAVRRLVAFCDSLGITVKYVPLLDYSNSRGALDMGLLPDLAPGYQPVTGPGLNLDQMLAAKDLDVLWVVGANPLEATTLESANAFVVVQDLFLTETAQRANVVLPAASAYEKSGTVTNTCGEVQRLKAGPKVMGAKTDLEILSLIARHMGLDLGVATPDKLFEEIRRTVHGYNVALPVIATGGAAPPSPVNGGVAVASSPALIRPSGDTLFTSGTLGRYSKMLNKVMEAPGQLFKS